MCDAIERLTCEGREEPAAVLAGGGPGPCVFNEEDLIKNIGGDRDLLRLIVGLFLDDARAGLERFREALDLGDAAAIGRLAHKMKGAAANIRAEILAALLADMENAASCGDLAGAKRLFVVAGREFERFRDASTGKADRPL